MPKTTIVKFYFALTLLFVLVSFGLWGLFIFCQIATAKVNAETLREICGFLLFLAVIAAGSYCVYGVINNYRGESDNDVIIR